MPRLSSAWPEPARTEPANQEDGVSRLCARWLGRVGYGEALALQAGLVDARRDGRAPDSLLLLEHPPVITLGRTSDPGNVLARPDRLRQRGIEMHEVGRGGDVTFHGPGQIVGYPILALEGAFRDAHGYLRRLEEALIRTVRRYGVEADRIAGLTGIWVDADKLAAIGVRISSGWITSHGFALNVATDLTGFSEIVPCGISDRGVTSLAQLTGITRGLPAVARELARQVGDVFELETEFIDDTVAVTTAGASG